MEIVVESNVSAQEYFDFILSTYDSDLEANNLTRADLKKGLKFDKVIHVGAHKTELSSLKVTHYKYPSIIEVEYTASKGISLLRYECKSLTENTCEVRYTETAYDENHKPIEQKGFMANQSIKKRKKALNQIGDYLIQEKEKKAKEEAKALEQQEDVQEAKEEVKENTPEHKGFFKK